MHWLQHEFGARLLKSVSRSVFILRCFSIKADLQVLFLINCPKRLIHESRFAIHQLIYWLDVVIGCLVFLVTMMTGSNRWSCCSWWCYCCCCCCFNCCCCCNGFCCCNCFYTCMLMTRCIALFWGDIRYSSIHHQYLIPTDRSNRLIINQPCMQNVNMSRTSY